MKKYTDKELDEKMDFEIEMWKKILDREKNKK